MRPTTRGILALSLLAAGVQGFAARAAEDKSAREHEMLRRAQMQLQESQSQNAELQRGKSEAESRLRDTSSQLDSLRKDEAAARGRSEVLEGQARSARAASADLGTKLDAANRQLAELMQKQKDTAASLAQREAELATANANLARSTSDNAACEARNEQLYQYGQGLLQSYHDKGVWSALMDREPVLGLGHIKVENTVQEYRDKLAAQRMQKP
jgi:chromosome segregation ATPase